MEECCKGFTETNAGDRCIPICSQDCIHGKCIAPDVCKCESGYGGPLCDFSKHGVRVPPKTDKRETAVRSPITFNISTECSAGKWGKSCETDCMCQNGASCDPFDGKCICTRGYTGKYCDKTCPPDHYGQDCGEECRCRHGGSCHHISGECHCAPGYTGPL